MMDWNPFNNKPDAEGTASKSTAQADSWASRWRESRRKPRPIPLPEVQEGNQESDWEMWRDSVAFQESQFSSQSFPEEPVPLTDFDAFAAVTKKPD